MENKIILEASKISIGYTNKKKKNIIGSDIDLLLNESKLIALIGANGIGKSTLLKNHNRHPETPFRNSFFEWKKHSRTRYFDFGTKS